MRNLILLFFLFLSVSAVSQNRSKNTTVRTTTLTSDRVYQALQAGITFTASGADNYTVNTGLNLTIASDDKITIFFTNANTGTTPTVNIDGTGAKTVVDNTGSAIAAGDLEGPVNLMYDGTNLRIIGGSGGGGGGGTVTSVSGTTNRVTVANGTTTPIIDISATFEALLGKVAQRIDQNNASTTSAQLATTLSDEIGSGSVMYNTLSASSLTDGSSISITGALHTLTTDEPTITFSISYTGSYSEIEVTLNATTATYTFPGGSKCIVNGAPTGDNTMTVNGTSGDVYLLGIKKIGSNYYVGIKNTDQ